MAVPPGHNRREMARLIEDIEEAADEDVRDTARAVQTALLSGPGTTGGRTPVKTGRLVKRWTVKPGKPKLGDTVTFENRQFYGASINKGRRHHPGLGRKIGSEQAPKGVTGPAADAVIRSLKGKLRVSRVVKVKKTEAADE